MSGKLPILVLALVAVAVMGGLVFRAYRTEIDGARAAAATGSRIAKTSAGPIEYAERGTGLPLLAIHGAGGGYDQGLANAAELVGDGFRVIAPSRFGYLGTPIPADSSPSAQADAHAALLTALEIDKAIVVGISAGALSALELTLRHPARVNALILMVPAIYAPTSPVAIEGSRGSKLVFWLVNVGADFAWWAISRVAPSILVRFVGVPSEIVVSAPQAEQARVMRIVKSIQPLSQRFRGINLDSIPDLNRPALEKIGVRSLVVSARDDLFNTLPAAEFAAANIPEAQLIVFATGGHLLVGHQQAIRAAVGEFLARIGASPKRQ
jgi:pimeloyl-ACP methyl ester carboxylesterase